jgi:hypothetical protein
MAGNMFLLKVLKTENVFCVAIWHIHVKSGASPTMKYSALYLIIMLMNSNDSAN